MFDASKKCSMYEKYSFINLSFFFNKRITFITKVAGRVATIDVICLQFSFYN